MYYIHTVFGPDLHHNTSETAEARANNNSYFIFVCLELIREHNKSDKWELPFFQFRRIIQYFLIVYDACPREAFAVIYLKVFFFMLFGYFVVIHNINWFTLRTANRLAQIRRAGK